MMKRLLALILLLFCFPAFAGPFGNSGLLGGGGGWDLSTLAYSGKNVYVGGTATNPIGITFSPDGTKVYFAGAGTATIFEYILSTPWDISTATSSLSGSTSSTGDSGSLFITPNGLKMIISQSGGGGICYYNLSTAFNISTLSIGGCLSTGSNPGTVNSFSFDGTGLHLYMSDIGPDVYQWTLTAAYDLTTATYASKVNGIFGSQLSTIHNLVMRPNGANVYVGSGGSGLVYYEYNFTTPLDITTATYTGKSFDFNTLVGVTTTSIYIRYDGKFLYLVASGPSTIYQYRMGP